MAHHRNEMVDLLEIYHARSLRDQLLRHLNRLGLQDAWVPGSDPQHRQETREFYRAMLITSAALLENLGDGGPLA